MPPRLQGRIALVTGVGSPTGIGFATARVLGREGATLAITSTTDRIREREAELREAGHTAAGFVADLRAFDQATTMVRSVLERYDRIDVLVNNAGMAQSGVEDASKRFVDLTEDEWERTIAMNLTTTFNVTRCVLPGMVERGYGRVVNVSSTTGPLTAIPKSVAYGAAKAGVDGLTRGVALEVARHRITVNSVAPGWIETGSSLPEELIAGTHTPVGRPGHPDEVAEVVAFLASESSSYVTGRSIVVDGGNLIQEYKGPPEDWD
jgi:3-oxoacyl-[acyl-carrier protein] reductase